MSEKFLKGLKALFIVEEEKPTAPATPAAAPENPEGPEAAARSAGGQVTERFTEILLQAMERANREGFDYLEFKRSLQSLRDMPMDEATRYQSAFAMARAMGATPEGLADSARHYLEVLRGEEEKFQAAVAKQSEQQIGSREADIKKLEDTLRAKEEQIRTLEEEIAAHRRAVDALRLEMTEAAAKVESTRDDFVASYRHLVDQIEADAEKMKAFLKS